MYENYSASLINTVVYLGFATLLLGTYKYRIPHRALLWIAAALVLADDSVAYKWLLQHGSLAGELAAAIMGTLSGLSVAKASHLLANTGRLVPVTAFLTLPLSMTAVMLFNKPDLYVYQLAIAQLAIALAYAESAYVVWNKQDADMMHKNLAAAFAGLVAVYAARIAYGFWTASDGLSESAFLTSSFMETTLQINSVFVAGGLFAMLAIILRNHVRQKKSAATTATPAK